MSDPKEALERLIAALRERPKGAPGYDDQASSIEHQAADAIDALIAKQEGLERDYADLKSAIGGAATEEQTLRLIIRGYLAQQTAESKAEGLEREVARRQAHLNSEYHARKKAESRLSALEATVRSVVADLGSWDAAEAKAGAKAYKTPRHAYREAADILGDALLHPAVPVEPACAHQWFGKTSRAGQRWQCALCRKIMDQDPEGTSPVPPSQGAAPNVVHHHNIHPWAQPGDRPDRWWRLRFDDQDMREMIWSGPDAEREARAAYAQYSPAWNCYLFATVEARAQAHPDVAGLVEALKLGLELKLSAYPAHGSGFVAILTAGNLDVFQAKAADALAAFQSRQAAR